MSKNIETNCIIVTTWIKIYLQDLLSINLGNACTWLISLFLMDWNAFKLFGCLIDFFQMPYQVCRHFNCKHLTFIKKKFEWAGAGWCAYINNILNLLGWPQESTQHTQSGAAPFRSGLKAWLVFSVEQPLTQLLWLVFFCLNYCGFSLSSSVELSWWLCFEPHVFLLA